MADTTTQPPVQEKFGYGLDDVQGSLQHRQPKVFFLAAFITVIASLIFFLIWVFTTPYGYPWFIYPAGVLVLATILILVWGSPRFTDKPYSIHVVLFLGINALLILTNFKTSAYPWAVYPLFVSLAVCLLHTTRVFLPQYFTPLTIHLIISCCINFTIFLTWAYTTSGWPWFFITFFFASAALVGHFIFSLKKMGYAFKKPANAAGDNTATDGAAGNAYNTTFIGDYNYNNNSNFNTAPNGAVTVNIDTNFGAGTGYNAYADQSQADTTPSFYPMPPAPQPQPQPQPSYQSYSPTA